MVSPVREYSNPSFRYEGPKQKNMHEANDTSERGRADSVRKFIGNLS
jgi:hypothetical protein